MIRLEITVEDITNVIAAGYDRVRVYTDTSSSGTFTTLDGNVSLSANTTGYEYVDTDGTTSTWYKTAYYGSSPGESSKSSAQQGGTQDSYCTVLDVKGELGMAARQNLGDKSDHWISEMITQASRLIDDYCGCAGLSDLAYLASTSATRTMDGDGSDWLWLDKPMTSVTSVSVEETDGTWTSYGTDDYWPWPWNDTPKTALVIQDRTGSEETNWDSGHRRVAVCGVFGLATSVPALIKRACITQVAIWYKRAMAGWRMREGDEQFGFLEYPGTLSDDVMAMLDAEPKRVKRYVF